MASVGRDWELEADPVESASGASAVGEATPGFKSRRDEVDEQAYITATRTMAVGTSLSP